MSNECVDVKASEVSFYGILQRADVGILSCVTSFSSKG